MQNYSDRQVIAAFFRNQNSAENAIDELRRSGFKANQIGCSYDSPAQTDIQGSNRPGSNVSDTDINTQHNRSFWQKVEGFFTGDEGYEDRNTGADDGRYNEGNVVGTTLNIPDRYNDRIRSGGCIVTVHESSRFAEAEQILTRNGGEIDREFATGTATSRTASQDRNIAQDVTGERRIRLVSEMLRVNKERVSAGEVRLRKEVRTETQNIEVPVTHEELVVERVPVEGRAATDANIGQDEEIRVPLSEERVVVDKTPVVREEVRVGKRAVQDTEHVTDQVRHEDLKVDDQTKKVTKDPKKKKIA